MERGQRRCHDYLRRLKFAALGWYQYVIPVRDAAQHAREFCDTVGPSHENEFAVCDSEDGSESQVARARTWLKS